MRQAEPHARHTGPCPFLTVPKACEICTCRVKCAQWQHAVVHRETASDLPHLPCSHESSESASEGMGRENFHGDDLDSIKQDVRLTDKHLGRLAEVFVALRGHGCRSVRVVSG